MPDVVAARGLGVRYGGRRSAPTDALTAIDLACHDGETVGVLGPNGAGKSTLLAALATLLRPTSGELRLFGRPAEPAPGMRRRLGYAPDAAPHFDALSGRENAVFFARASGLAAEPARTSVDRLLDRLDLADDADRRVGEYSFGMGRKLALVEALAHEPRLLLLDEPTVGLDPRALDALRGLLRERAAAGTTIVIATNDVREAQSLCDRVVFLQHGRIVLEGEPAALVRASGARTRIEVGLDSDTAPVPALPDVEAEAAAPGRLVLRSAAGADLLPDVCRALVDAGVGIRSIRVREPDLRDVFFEATGAELAPAADGTSARATEPAATLSHARA